MAAHKDIDFKRKNDDTEKALAGLVDEGFLSPQEVSIPKNSRGTIAFTVHSTGPYDVNETFFTETGKELRDIDEATMKYKLQKVSTSRKGDTRVETYTINFELNSQNYLNN